MKLRCALAMLAVVPSAAMADFTSVTEVLSNGKLRQVTFSSKQNRAYFEVHDAQGRTHVMLRDAKEKKTWVVNHEKKLLLVLSEEDEKALDARQAQFRSQLSAQLEKLPAAQRERLQQALMPQEAGNGETFTYEKKSTPSRKIAGLSCTEYLVRRGDKAFGEGCFVPWKSVSVSPDEFKTVLKRSLPPQALGMQLQAFEAAAKAPGFVAERIIFDGNGQVLTKMTLKSFSKTAIEADKFELPTGYTEKPMGASMPQLPSEAGFVPPPGESSPSK